MLVCQCLSDFIKLSRNTDENILLLLVAHLLVHKFFIYRGFLWSLFPSHWDSNLTSAVMDIHCPKGGGPSTLTVFTKITFNHFMATQMMDPNVIEGPVFRSWLSEMINQKLRRIIKTSQSLVLSQTSSSGYRHGDPHRFSFIHLQEKEGRRLYCVY